ncbi:MAG TPA: hypothetical protein VHI93_00235, partial [Candidatus Thermoplasmatota archaeon]|nr:hypothetical protein [Candidatus Thermoplasmatota archaeon]
LWLAHAPAPSPSLEAAYACLWGRDLPPAETLEGLAAFEHLCEVASSLDSLVPGEPQVLGQFREAVRRCTAADALDPELTHLLGRVLQVARQVRAWTGLFQGKVGLVSLADDAVRQALAGPGAAACVLGTGEMGARAAALVRRARPDAPLHVASRSIQRARDFAAAHAATPHHLPDLLRSPPAGLSLVVSALQADVPVLGAAFLGGLARQGPVTVLDLCMPRSVEPPAAPVPGLTLLQLDDLARLSGEGKARREAAYAEARAALRGAIARARHEERLRGRAMALRQLGQRFEEVMERRWREAQGLDTRDPRARKWYEQTVRALMHEATAALKAPEAGA